MDDSSSNNGNYQKFTPSEDLAQEKQQGRGITHMKKLIKKKRSDGVKETITYNQWEQALGQKGTHLVSTVESLARKYMPINIDHWAQVPKEKKTSIWETILVRVLSVVFSTICKMFVSFLIYAFLL